MVDIGGLKTGRFKGIIDTVEEVPLKDFLSDPDKIKKFMENMRDDKLPRHLQREGVTKKEIQDYKERRMETNVIVVNATIKVNNETRHLEKWLNIPSTGYGRSLLKQVHDLNRLPDNTDDWVGKEIEVYPDKDGYLQLIPS